MKRMHDQEKEQFEKLFRQEGIDQFEDRFNILDVLLQTEKHVTLEELTQLLERNGYKLDAGFVGDTLKLLCDYGFAQKIQFDNEPIRYEHRHLGWHHDHMICTKCGRIIEFNDDRLDECRIRAVAVHGFHMLQHKTEIYGICSECANIRETSVPLAMAKQGERLIIKDIIGGGNAKMRLAGMGLRLGDELEVLCMQGRGQMVVSVDCSRYVLGCGMLNKIMVVPAPKPPLKKCDQQCLFPPLEPPQNTMLMSEMKEGQTGRIFRVGGCGMLRRRILEMGITRGSEVYIEKYAPLKDPLELIVKGYHVSLRVEEAARIMVHEVKDKV